MPRRHGRLGLRPWSFSAASECRSTGWLVVWILLLPWLVVAQQQQRPPAKQQSPAERRQGDVLTFEATQIPALRVETPLVASRRKDTRHADADTEGHGKRKRHGRDESQSTIRHTGDEGAVALASDTQSAAVELARSSRHGSGSLPTAGLASPLLHARSLEDWEIEDIVLLATIDGRLWARDRKTGKERWHLGLETAMVETTHFGMQREQRGQDGAHSKYQEGTQGIDDYLWIVEPTRDGALYIYKQTDPGRGLMNTGLTISKLVEKSPYKTVDPPVIYTGRKNTSMITVDAKTGNLISWFGSDGGSVNQEENCPRQTGLVDSDNDACSSRSTIVLGRTDYVVNIMHRDGQPIATLKYSEWGPNNFDQDLHQQYHMSLDQKYIYTGHDGGVIGFDHARSNDDDFGKLFKHKLPSPVARVFDVARSWATGKPDAELVVLPQPKPPILPADEAQQALRASRIFLNHTDDGSWFAMSGAAYPMAVEGVRQAPCNRRGWSQDAAWAESHSLHESEALVGIHSVETRQEALLTISGPLNDSSPEAPRSALSVDVDTSMSFLNHIRQLPHLARDSLIAFISNPILLLCLLGLLITNQRQLRSWIGQHSHKVATTSHHTSFHEPKANVEHENPVGVTLPLKTPEAILVPDVETPESDQSIVVEIKAAQVDGAGESKLGEEASVAEPTPKKKRSRGTRGGVKHRKGRQQSQDHAEGLLQKPVPTIEDAVRQAKQMGEPPKLEPDVRTLPQDPAEVSGPIIRIGALTVDTERLIGTGSNGTMVFEGKFDGREVAVKRMLIQFFDIASQETKLLRESDDHPNGKSKLSIPLAWLTSGSHSILCSTASRRLSLHSLGIVSCFSGGSD